MQLINEHMAKMQNAQLISWNMVISTALNVSVASSSSSPSPKAGGLPLQSQIVWAMHAIVSRLVLMMVRRLQGLKGAA